MKKIGTFLLAVLLLNVVMAAGLVGFVVATGRLDGAKAKTIMDLVRRKGSPEGLREKVSEVMEPATMPAGAEGAATQAAGVKTAAGGATDAKAAASALDRIEYARQAMEQERLRLDREAQDLQQRQKLLETQGAAVESKLAQIVAEKKSFDAEVAAAKTRVSEESFKRSLAIYSDLKPKQVKELFIGLTPELVANYLEAMDGDQVTKVISEFKTTEEKGFIGQVLERIRSSGTGAASGGEEKPVASSQ